MDSEIKLHFTIQIFTLVCSFHPSAVLAGRCWGVPGRVEWCWLDLLCWWCRGEKIYFFKTFILLNVRKNFIHTPIWCFCLRSVPRWWCAASQSLLSRIISFRAVLCDKWICRLFLPVWMSHPRGAVILKQEVLAWSCAPTLPMVLWGPQIGHRGEAVLEGGGGRGGGEERRRQGNQYWGRWGGGSYLCRYT